MYKAYDKAAIQSVIDEYRLSDIQSESEVRSKFIVRLSEVLGYSSQFREKNFQDMDMVEENRLEQKMWISFF